MKRCLLVLILLSTLSCSNDTDMEPCLFSPMQHYKGSVFLQNKEGFELRIGLGIDSPHAECLYTSLYSGELKKGYIDGAGGYYKKEEDAFTIFVEDTVYMVGHYLDDNKTIEVSRDRSLGRMWDTCAVRYNWPRNMVLSIFYEDE